MMTKNQKIALGCGGAGCLGLILIVIVCVVLVAAGYVSLPGGFGSTRNYNSNSNSNFNSNSNTNENLNSNSNSSSDSSSSMSDDDKHKLFQAAGITKDNDLILRVIRKIGFGSGTGSDYQEFVKDHFAWAMKNLDFIRSVNTPEKARAYIDEHIED
jgi:predicted metalloprotease